MRKAVDLHYGDVVIAQQFDQPFDERGYQQRHIAAGYVGYIDGIRQRSQPRSQSFERPPVLAFIAGDGNFIRQLRQRLLTRRDDYHGGNDCPEQPHHTLQHCFGTEGQGSFGNTHSGRLPATQNDATRGHGFNPRRASASRVDACCSSALNATTPGRFMRDPGTMKSYCSACTGRNPSPALRAMVSSVIPQSARPCTTAAATAL